MLNKKLILAAAAGMTLVACGSDPYSYSEPRYVSSSTYYNGNGAYNDFGRVVAIDVVRGGGRSTGAGAVVGGIVGGVLGHQIGSGRGNDAATAAGALIGANHAAANSYRSGRVVEREVIETRCETVRDARYESRLEGYDVTYRYQGRLYQTRTNYDPGKRIRVRVEVTPARWDDLD